ncbi:hypothetical protein Ait01nite_031750 [Actinoplanes italicus]|uniref:Uncharacterized protein n=1 Tax=Actinoplanes italicus TaxID=113567 RepID=A0A2T0KJC0_9ACTN|nr:hypothetical protein [Actinoplanes italicus]PRX23630.1 hypothetical protein CLV67_103379 [Actinoplanes italicus]GIE30130.1 hypothetical protein Ait01nite_031750 [Actinoplanes italicus]
MSELPPAFRSLFDQGLAELVDKMLASAADYDGLDDVEANIDFAHEISVRMEPHALPVIVAALALRMHRSREVAR